MIRRRNESAFTLIELMFVMMVIALMSSIVLPKISAIFGITLRTGASQVSGYLRSAYEQAVMRHQRVRVKFNLAGGSYWVETFEEAPEVPLITENTKLDDALKEFEDIAARGEPTPEEKLASEQKRYKKVEAGTLKPSRLPDGVKFKGVYTGLEGKLAESGATAIEFTPNGFVPKTIVYVTNEREDVYTVILAPLGGRSKVEKGEVRPDDA